MSIEVLARRIVDQWENYDKLSIPSNEDNSDPDAVVLAKWILKNSERDTLRYVIQDESGFCFTGSYFRREIGKIYTEFDDLTIDIKRLNRLYPSSKFYITCLETGVTVAYESMKDK